MSPEEIKQRLGAFKFYGVLVAVVLLALYLGMLFGNEYMSMQQHEIDTLKASTQNLKSDNERLTRDLNVLGVELEVQRLANQRAQEEIQQSLDKQAVLAQELSFYQKVMAPELREQGFVVDAFDVERTLSENHYRFDLVMVQHSKLKHVIKGNIDVVLVGSEQGKPKEIRLLDVITGDKKQLAFSFKYFQKIEGEINLPESFTPEEVRVHAEVFQFKKKRGDLTVTFPWIATSNNTAAVSE